MAAQRESRVTGCIFCQIAAREVPVNVLYEDADVLAFRDIHPKYRVHILLIPKAHLVSVAGLRPEHDVLLGRLLRLGADLARQEGIAATGYRLLTNTGPDSGQVVPHLHIHLVGGEPLRSM